MIDASRNQEREGRPAKRFAVHPPRLKAVIAALLVAMVLLGAAAVYQQEQISSLNRQLGTSTAVIDGVRYWELPFPASAPNGTSVTFHGVTFTSLSLAALSSSYSDPSKYTFDGSVRLSNGTLLNLTGKTVEITLHFKFPSFLLQNGTAQFFAPTPAVLVSFPGGEREVYDGWTLTASNVPASMNIPYEHVLLNETDLSEVANPWFTAHTGAQAGVLWNDSSDLTFYVSTD